MTLSNVKGHSPTASLFKRYFPYSSAGLEKISTDKASRGPSVIAVLLFGISS